MGCPKVCPQRHCGPKPRGAGTPRLMHRMNQSDAPGNRMSNICDVNLSEATPALFADYLSTQGANGVVFNDKLAASLGADLPRVSASAIREGKFGKSHSFRGPQLVSLQRRRATTRTRQSLTDATVRDDMAHDRRWPGSSPCPADPRSVDRTAGDAENGTGCDTTCSRSLSGESGVQGGRCRRRFSTSRIFGSRCSRVPAGSAVCRWWSW